MSPLKAAIYSSVLLCLSIPGHVWADDTQERLIGHREKEEKLVSKVDAIVVGQFLSLGVGPSADNAGKLYYGKAKVKIEQSLKGSLSGNMTVFYSVQTLEEKERDPQLSRSYIFFIEILSPSQFGVTKLTPASEDNITRIKTLLADRTTTK